MKISRLNKYRELNAAIAKNKRVLQAASTFLYADDRFPGALAELAEKTKTIEEYREKNYGDVVEFLGNASLKDFRTGLILQGYYHNAMTWEQLAASNGMTTKDIKALAAAYIEENCEKDPEPKPAAPAPGHRAAGRPAMPAAPAPGHRAAGRPAMHFPGMGIMSKHHSAVML